MIIGATTLFSDTFNGRAQHRELGLQSLAAEQRSVSSTAGRRSASPCGRRQRHRPLVDTYNPGDKDHKTFIGAVDDHQEESFGPRRRERHRLRGEGRVRDMPEGLVGGIFTFSGNAKSDEIDWEALSNDLRRAPTTSGHARPTICDLPLTDYHVSVGGCPTRCAGWSTARWSGRDRARPDKAMASQWAPASGWKDA